VFGSGTRSVFLSRPSLPAATKMTASGLSFKNASILPALVSKVFATEPHEKLIVRAPFA
jgi:hypothetical protein